MELLHSRFVTTLRQCGGCAAATSAPAGEVTLLAARVARDLPCRAGGVPSCMVCAATVGTFVTVTGGRLLLAALTLAPGPGDLGHCSCRWRCCCWGGDGCRLTQGVLVALGEIQEFLQGQVLVLEESFSQALMERLLHNDVPDELGLHDSELAGAGQTTQGSDEVSGRRVTTTGDTGDQSPATFGLLGTVPSKTDE